MTQISRQPSRTTPGYLNRPVFWLAVLLLILNDAWLKYAYPSLVTGKLSDFAGLFVLPLVAVAALRMGGWGQRQVERVVFSAIGIWFAAMKVIPGVNEATVALWSWLAGGPVQIMLDATDLIGLLAMWPAWRVAQAPALIARRRWRRMVAGAGLLLGALASLGSSCDPHDYNHLTLVQGRLFAGDNHQIAEYNFSTGAWRQVAWQEQRTLLSDALAHFDEPIPLPKIVCTSTGDHCYRISGETQVDVSSDGGETWAIAWAPPAGRLEFARRYRRPNICDSEYGPEPVDLTLVERGREIYVFAARGEEGVLRLDPAGNWTRQMPDGSEPVPWTTTDGSEAFYIVGFEWYTGLLLALLLLAVLVLVALPRAFWPGWPWVLWSGAGLLPFSLFLILLAPGSTFVPDLIDFLSLITLFWAMVFVLGLLWPWQQFLSGAWRSNWAFAAFICWAVGGLLVAAIFYAVFWRWATGAIPIHADAQALALGLSGLVAVLTGAVVGGWRFRRGPVTPAAKADANEEGDE